MARNQRRRTQEALFTPAPSTTPPDEEKAERTETALTGDKTCDRALVEVFRDRMDDHEAGMVLASKVGVLGSPAYIIREEYGIAANCTNVPQILRAILCEMVRRRV